MIYPILILLFLVSFIGLLACRNKRIRLKKIKAVKDKWAKPTSTDRDFKLIASYHDHNNKNGKETLSDAICQDIDLENIFTYADRSNSRPGQQYLYQRLRSAHQDIRSLQELDNLADQFADDELRSAVELELSGLNNKNAYYIHELFTSAYPSLYSALLSTYIKLAGILWLVLLTMTITKTSQLFFWITLCLTCFNFYLHFRNKNKISRYFHSLPQLHLLIKVTKKILKRVQSPQNEQAATSLRSLSPLKNSLAFVSFEDQINKDPSDFLSGIWELFKTVLLAEAALFLVSIDKVNKQRENIKILFEYVAATDLAISVRSLRTGLPYYSKPVFITGKKELSVSGLYHPLVADCVPNSIEVSVNQGVLITGSNMSGKTTFIRRLRLMPCYRKPCSPPAAGITRPPFWTYSPAYGSAITWKNIKVISRPKPYPYWIS